MKKSSILRTVITYVLLIALAIYSITMLESQTKKDMSYTEFMQKVEAKNVSSVVISNDRQTAEVKLKDEEDVTRVVSVPDSTTLLETLQPRVVAGEFELSVAKPSVWEEIAPFMPTILLLIGTLFIFIYMIRKTGEGNTKAMNFGKNRAQVVDKNSKKKVTLKMLLG